MSEAIYCPETGPNGNRGMQSVVLSVNMRFIWTSCRHQAASIVKRAYIVDLWRSWWSANMSSRIHDHDDGVI